MKHIKSLLLVAILGLAVACGDDNTSAEFGIDTSEFEFGPEGGTRSVRVSADKNWTASTDKPWILVTPANGNASTECKIRVDSTLLSRQETGSVTFSIEGQERKINISREGFPVEITIPEESRTISLPDYADVDDAYFDVEVTSNVEFTVQIPEDVTWVRADEFRQAPRVGYRPRTTKIRFTWDINSKPMEQQAEITFKPKETVTLQDKIAVVQQAAPLIEPSRAGDSLALLAIARNLKIWGSGFDTSKSMIYWDNVTLWDVKDEGVRKENIGRVKYAKFYIFNTKMSLPYEVKYLTAVDSLVFYSNENRTMRDIELGPEICELTDLRALTIEAYGLSKLPAEFTKLKNLESLSIGSNNFQTLPLDMVNATNFPKLKRLSFNYMRTKEVYDLSNNIEEGIGVRGAIPEELFRWDALEELAISFCYFEGAVPAMKNAPKYTAEDEAVKKGLVQAGTPKVLPNMKSLRINGNRLTGEIPAWILLHPNLYEWNPYTFIFNQEGKDSEGSLAGFTNVPENVEPPTVTD